MTGIDQMLNELESYQLCVILVPAPEPAFEGHMIRAAIERNPLWYRRLCGQFTSQRRSGRITTRIKRQSVLRILRRLQQGKKSESYLVPYLKDTAEALEVKAA